MENNHISIRVENVSKQYRLGAIGGTTLRDDLQRLSARIRGKEDPTSKVGTQIANSNETFLALQDINFEIKQGERVGIIGHNGAGKSTLLKLLSRVTAPTTGSIKYNGRIASMLEVGTGFHPELTGRENVYMNGAILGMTKAEIDSKFDEIVAFAEMEKFIDTPVKRYSSGMYVKLAFAVAAHLDSEILIMDEVLAVGDMKFQQKCLGKMDSVSKNEGRTILYVSHNMNTIKQLCNRCIVLNRGRVVFDGDVDEAISLYLGVNGDNAVVFPLEDLPRDKSNSYLHIRARMREMRIVNAEYAVFSSNEPMKLGLVWEALEDCDDVFIRLVFKYIDASPAGFATTIKPISLRKGEKTMTHLTVDLNMFASGRYYAGAAIYKTVNGSGHDILDSVECALRFQVDNKSGRVNRLPSGEQHRYWGHAVFDPIEIREEA